MSRDIPITEIEPDPDQPRQHFAGVEDLAASLDQQGQAVPIAVRTVPGGYQIIHGERRWRAARSLNWATIEASVKDVGEEEARWLSLVENVQRDDLTPIEEARAYRRQIEAHDLTQTALAEKIGKSQSYVAQKLRLLRLPAPVSFWIERGALSEGHARQLMRVKGLYPEEARQPLNLSEDMDASDGLLYARLRPLNRPIWVPTEETSDMDLMREGVEALFRYARAEDCAPESHVVCAWWYGAFASAAGLTVAALQDAIDRFREHLFSAAARITSFDDVYTDGTGAQAMLHWGWWEDLKEAGLMDLMLSDGGLPEDFLREGALWMMDEGRYCLPTSLQGDTPKAKRYAKLTTTTEI